MIDEIFNYAPTHNLRDLLGQSVKLRGNARCRIRVSGHTVIVTELPDNLGMSLTNAAQAAALQVCQYHEIPVEHLIWIEHYPEGPNHEETFDWVHFSFSDGLLQVERWQRLSLNEAEQLFGERLS